MTEAATPAGTEQTLGGARMDTSQMEGAQRRMDPPPNMYKVIQWNIDLQRGRGRELIALIAHFKTSRIVVNEANAVSKQILREVWPGAEIEELPAVKKGWNSAPRAGVDIAVQPGLNCVVRAVYNEHEEVNNKIVQAITVDLLHRARVKGAYISPNTSAAKLTDFLSDVITSGSGRDWLVGDLNARNHQWDTAGNASRSVTRRRIGRTNDRVVAPQEPTFRERGLRASRIPDVVLTNVQGSRVGRKEEGMWKGSSDHTPIMLNIPGSET